MSLIDCKYIEPSQISGSTDLLRYLVGGYYQIETDEATGNQKLEYVGISEVEQSIGEFGHAITEIDDSPISKIITSYRTVSSSNDEFAVRSYQVPIRVYGNPAYVDSDKTWASYFEGSDADSVGITARVYEDHSFNIQKPYTQYNANVLASKYQTCQAVEISYDYNIYLPRFDEYVKRANVRHGEYPNYYYLWFITNGEQIDNKIESFITREGVVESGDIEKILQPIDTDIMPPTIEASDLDASSEYIDRSYNLREYLTSSMMINPISASTANYVNTRLDSIIFDTQAYIDSYDVPTFYNDLFPYYAKINFPWDIHDTNTIQLADTTVRLPGFIDVIRENKYEQLFLKYIKEIFSDELVRNGVIPNLDTFTKSSTYLSASEASDIVYEQEVANTENLRSYSLIDMLGYSYNNYSNQGAMDYSFMGQKTLERAAASVDGGHYYRHLGTSATLNTMRSLLETLIDDQSWASTYGVNSVSSINSISDLYAYNNEKYSEVLAYRIKKVEGPVSDIMNVRKTQDFWFPRVSPDKINADEGNVFSFIDSQIDVNRDYTYGIYAYVLVLGVRYYLSDIRYTEQIGTTSTGDYCLQFTAGDQPVPQLYSTVGTNIRTTAPVALGTAAASAGTKDSTEGNELLDLEGNEYVGIFYMIAGFAGMIYYEVDEFGNTDTTRPLTPIVTYNRFVTDAQISSSDPFLADMHLNYEPTATIIEVPITSKTISVQDYLPSHLEIEPSYELNDSQAIVFKLNYQPYDSVKFPYPIEPADVRYKEKYISSNNLLQNQTLPHGTRSPPLIMEIYRTQIRPKTMADFTGMLYKQINLTMAGDLLSHNDTFTLSIFNDTIKTNHKYYYLFRVLSKNGHAGYSSEIYEVELRSDGGYKYATFETIEQDGLDPDRPKMTHSRDLKKLIELKPAAPHLFLDTSEVDFTQKAMSQIEKVNIGESTLEDPVWGKTFKIRLTSKKTGKKIDLNISYELQSD